MSTRAVMTKAAAAAVAVTAIAGLALQTPTALARGGFKAPVKVTPELGYGYEPGVVVDRFGNIFATAHKENWQLVIAPDEDSPTFTRSMSWAWVSVDNGQSFTDIPGLSPADIEQHEFGDEGDMAIDDADHLYFVDTHVDDVTFTRWHMTGRGLDNIELEVTRPILPNINPLDDRPWIIAHRDGEVFYFGNDGGKEGDGGRYTVYPSHDAGDTFDPVGHVLRDSGWCHPTADHRPGSHHVFAICTNDEGRLYTYVTCNEGRAWRRFKMGHYNADDATQSWPTGEMGSDGTLWALYVDADQVDEDGLPITNRLRLFRSTDMGRTWTDRDITPMVGRYQYGWLSVSPDGQRLGIAVYYRPDANSDWRVYGATFDTTATPHLVSLDPDNPVAQENEDEAPGDFLTSYFGPDGKLNIVWTRIVERIAPFVARRDIYYVRSR